MLIMLSRTLTFLCLTTHQVLMYFMGLLTISVIGIFFFVFKIVMEGFDGIYGDPEWRIYFYIVCVAVLGIVLFMTTPIGERILRMFFVMRKPTLREEEKLNKAYELVKTAYKDKYGSEIKITPYVVDSPFLNGFALGNSTIALNSGVVRDAEIEEIAAIIAHECAHLHYGDGLYNSMMFGAGSHMQIFFRGGKDKEQNNGSAPSNGIASIIALPLAIISMVIMPLVLIVQNLDRAVNWRIEYRADDFADNLGFGDGLIKFFERLEAIDVREDHGFLKAYRYSHPPVLSRIDKIEQKHLAG